MSLSSGVIFGECKATVGWLFDKVEICRYGFKSFVRNKNSNSLEISEVRSKKEV